MENENKLGAYLKEVRNNRGLSLRDVASQIDISASYINRIEKGERKQISTSMLAKLSDYYKIPVLELYKIAGIDTEVQSQSIELMAIDTEYISINGTQVRTEGFKEFIKTIISLDLEKTEDVIKLVDQVTTFQTYACQ